MVASKLSLELKCIFPAIELLTVPHVVLPRCDLHFGSEHGTSLSSYTVGGSAWHWCFWHWAPQHFSGFSAQETPKEQKVSLKPPHLALLTALLCPKLFPQMMHRREYQPLLKWTPQHHKRTLWEKKQQPLRRSWWHKHAKPINSILLCQNLASSHGLS